MSGNFWTRLRRSFGHAFAVPRQEQLTREEAAVLDRAAELVVARHLAVAGVLFLESSRPLGFLANQGLTLLGPVLEVFFNPADYRTLTRALEKRASVDYLLAAIETRQLRREQHPLTDQSRVDDKEAAK